MGVRLGLGNINTFLQKAEDNNDVDGMVSDFFKEIYDGLSICVSEDGISASYFLGENEFPGITAHTRTIIHLNIPL